MAVKPLVIIKKEPGLPLSLKSPDGASNSLHSPTVDPRSVANGSVNHGVIQSGGKKERDEEQMATADGDIYQH